MTARPILLLLLTGILTLAAIPTLLWQQAPATDNAATADPTTTVATTVLSAVPTPDAEATQQPLISSVSVSALLRRYLQLEAGSPKLRAAWSGHIREVVVGLRTAKIRTDLGDSLDDKRMAEEIAAAVARFSTSPLGQGIRALDIEVLGANQQPLASQTAAGLARQSPRK